MPLWTVEIDRTVTTYDRFTRVVEADTLEEAEALGDRIASAADRSCPDDAGLTNYDADYGGWLVNETREAEGTELFVEPISAATFDPLNP